MSAVVEVCRPGASAERSSESTNPDARRVAYSDGRTNAAAQGGWRLALAVREVEGTGTGPRGESRKVGFTVGKKSNDGTSDHMRLVSEALQPAASVRYIALAPFRGVGATDAAVESLTDFAALIMSKRTKRQPRLNNMKNRVPAFGRSWLEHA